MAVPRGNRLIKSRANRKKRIDAWYTKSFSYDSIRKSHQEQAQAQAQAQTQE
jgi:hypothetical protein